MSLAGEQELLIADDFFNLRIESIDPETGGRFNDKMCLSFKKKIEI